MVMAPQMQACQVVFVQVPADGTGFYPVGWGCDQTKDFAPQMWHGDVQGIPMMYPVMPADVQGIPMTWQQADAASDAGSTRWNHSDAESSHSSHMVQMSSGTSDHGAEADSRASRSTLRRERRKRAARMSTATGAAAAVADKKAEHRADLTRTGTMPKTTVSSSEQASRELLPEARREPDMSEADRESEAAFCAQVTQALEEGGDARARALAALKGSVRGLSFTAPGCRVVQLALQAAAGSAAAELVAELHGHVREAITSPHANFVIQKVIEVMTAAQAGFIADELRGMAPMVARHSYGCRILCRLFEQCLTAPGPTALAAEILAEAARLSWHSYGHHVVETILEHGGAEQRRQICAALRGGDGSAEMESGGGKLVRSARNRSASHVVEKALTFCCAEDRAALVEELLGSPDAVVALAQSHFGIHVATALLQLPGELPRTAKAYIAQNPAAFQGTKHGRRLLEELGVPEPA